MQHVVHIGWHKTGSTWLQSCVFPHLHGIRSMWRDRRIAPLLREVSHGETWRSDVLGEAIRKRSGRHGRLLLTNEALCGDLTETNDGPTILDRLAQVVPDAKVFGFVRSQPDMIWSLYNLHVLGGVSLNFTEWFATLLDLDRLHYVDLVEAYMDQFGRENVLVLPYELLRADPAGIIDRLCAFMGAECGRWERRVVNPSLSRPSLRLMRAWSRAGGNTKKLRHVVQPRDGRLPLPRGPGRTARALIAGETGCFEESNRRLGELVGVDLGDFGYPLRAAR